MTTCEACEKDVDDDLILATRGVVRDRPGTVIYVCRDCWPTVLHRGTVQPPEPTLKEELDTLFGNEDAA